MLWRIKWFYVILYFLLVFQLDVSLIPEIRERVRTQCVKVGVIKKIVVYDVSLIFGHISGLTFVLDPTLVVQLLFTPQVVPFYYRPIPKVWFP